MNQKFEYDEIIHEIPENGGAYVIVVDFLK